MGKRGILILVMCALTAAAFGRSGFSNTGQKPAASSLPMKQMALLAPMARGYDSVYAWKKSVGAGIDTECTWSAGTALAQTQISVFEPDTSVTKVMYDNALANGRRQWVTPLFDAFISYNNTLDRFEYNRSGVLRGYAPAGAVGVGKQEGVAWPPRTGWVAVAPAVMPPVLTYKHGFDLEAKWYYKRYYPTTQLPGFRMETTGWIPLSIEDLTGAGGIYAVIAFKCVPSTVSSVSASLDEFLFIRYNPSLGYERVTSINGQWPIDGFRTRTMQVIYE